MSPKAIIDKGFMERATSTSFFSPAYQRTELREVVTRARSESGNLINFLGSKTIFRPKISDLFPFLAFKYLTGSLKAQSHASDELASRLVYTVCDYSSCLTSIAINKHCNKYRLGAYMIRARAYLGRIFIAKTVFEVIDFRSPTMFPYQFL